MFECDSARNVVLKNYNLLLSAGMYGNITPHIVTGNNGHNAGLEFIFNIKTVRDSLIAVVRDSLIKAQVPIYVNVPTPVKVPLTAWQNLRITLGSICLGFLGLAAIFGAIKLYLKFKP